MCGEDVEVLRRTENTEHTQRGKVLFNTTKKIAVAVGAAALIGGVAVPQMAQASEPDRQIVGFYNAALDQMADSNGSGQTPITWDPNGNDYQKWSLDKRQADGPAGTLIRNVQKNLCLQAPPRTGDDMLLRTCNVNNPAQLWVLPRSANEVFIALATDNDRVVSASGRNGNLKLASRSNSSLQRWVEVGQG
jgi:hypothetical protein